ncbi:MAG: HsdM family class I SAM-dependent methyltransferase [Acidobacteriota bacterium]
MYELERKQIDPAQTAQKLVEELGLRSATGSSMIDWLERKLMAHRMRNSIVDEWQNGMGRASELQHRNAVKSLERQGQSDLNAGEKLICRQTYYSLVVQLVTWHYLAVGKGGSAGTLAGLQTLVSGEVFARMGINNLGLEGLPAWHAMDGEWTADVKKMVAAVWRFNLHHSGTGDIFQNLYEDLIPREVRHSLGEHYTPPWLAAHIMDRIGYYGQDESAMLDPACGSGAFLVEALIRRNSNDRQNLPMVVGFDINPLAVLTARANYLMASDFTPTPEHTVAIPVYLIDSILAKDESLWDDSFQLSWRNHFDYVLGNPPWVNWEDLSPEYREASMEYWKRYGLFAHKGMDVILGKGKKDLSTLMTLSSASRYLKDKGRLAFLITQSVFKSGGAAEGFRRFQLPEGVDLKVLMAEDMVGANPFASATNRTGIIYLQRDAATQYPIPYILWQDKPSGPASAACYLDMVAEPVSPAEPTSPWLTCQPECLAIVHKVLGKSEYNAHEGANTGGANGILWVEILGQPAPGLVKIRNLAASSRSKLPVIETIIEEELIFPLLKGKDVRRWQVVPSVGIILTQDVMTRKGIPLLTMSRQYPRTLKYLIGFEKELRNRAAYKRYFKDNDPFYSMFDVGEYTLARNKVVWQRFGSRIQAAVVESIDKTIICQETHSMVACHSADEAWYLAGLLNSQPVEYAIKSYSMVGGKSFASPHIFKYINFPSFDGGTRQMAVAKAARKVAAGDGDESLLNRKVAVLYDITGSELELLQAAWQALKG